MSRPLVLLCALLALALGIAPLVVMGLRIAPADLAGLFDPRTRGLLWRTLLAGGGATALAVAVGLPYGYLCARTDVRGAALLRPLGLVPLLLPSLFQAMTWCAIVPLRGGPMTVLMLAASSFPLVGVFAARAFERIDARREEAALLAGGLRAALVMELPLILPATLAGAALVFVFVVQDFSLPDYVSTVGRKFNVYADEIFATWQIDHADGKAVAAALPLLALSLAALLPALYLRRRGSMATIPGDFRAPRRIALGRLRWPATFFAWSVPALTVFVPLGRLLYEAGRAPAGWSHTVLQKAFATAIERAGDNLLASLGIAVVTACAVLPPALVLGHALERSRLGRALEWLALLPLAVPAILFAIGGIALFSRPWAAEFYSSRAMVVWMYAGRYLAFPILIVAAAVAALDVKLEEAAEVAGAGPLRRLGFVVAPSIWPALLGGWILVFVFCVRELDAAILVPAANEAVMIRVYNALHFGRDDFVAALALLVAFVILLPGLLWSLFGGRRLEVLS